MNKTLFYFGFIGGGALALSPSIASITKIPFLIQHSFSLEIVGTIIFSGTLLTKYFSNPQSKKTENWWMDILAYYFIILGVSAFFPGYPYEQIVDSIVIVLFLMWFMYRWKKLKKEADDYNKMLDKRF